MRHAARKARLDQLRGAGFRTWLPATADMPALDMSRWAEPFAEHYVDLHCPHVMGLDRTQPPSRLYDLTPSSDPLRLAGVRVATEYIMRLRAHFLRMRGI